MTSLNNAFWYRANGNKDYVDQLISSDQRKDLIMKLKSFIKSCLACYFSTNKPLSGQSGNTEQDGAVFELCSILEYYLSHRIKPNVSLWTIIQMLPQLSTKNNLSTLEIKKTVNWKEEFEYLFSLSEITTDLGRTRAFIRRSLNESHLNQSFELIATNLDILKNYYEEGSILKFKEESDLFRSLLVSLQTIPFQIDYNDSNLDQLVLESPLQEEDQITINSEQSLNSFEINMNNNNSSSLESTSEKPKVLKKKVVKSLTRNIDLDGNENNEIIESEQQTQKIIVKKVVKRIKVKKPVQTSLSSSTNSTTDLTSSNNSLNSSTSSISSPSLDSSQTIILPTSVQTTPPPTPIQITSIPIETTPTPTAVVITTSINEQNNNNNNTQILSESPSLNSPIFNSITSKPSSPVLPSSPIIIGNSSPPLPIALPIMKQQSRYSSAYVPSKPTTPILSSSLSNTPPTPNLSSPPINTNSIVNIESNTYPVNTSPPITKANLSIIEPIFQVKNLEPIEKSNLELFVKEEVKEGKNEILDNSDTDLDDIQNTLLQIENLDFFNDEIENEQEEEEEVFRDEDEDEDDYEEENEIEELKVEEKVEVEEKEVIHDIQIEESVSVQQVNNVIKEVDSTQYEENVKVIIEEVKSNPIISNEILSTFEIPHNNSSSNSSSNNLDNFDNDKFKYHEDNEYVDSDDDVITSNSNISVNNNFYKNQNLNISENYFNNHSNNNINNSGNNSFRIKSSSSALSFVNSDELEDYSEDVITSNMLSSSDSTFHFNDYELLNDPDILEFIESSKNLPDLNSSISSSSSNNFQAPKSPNININNNISNNSNEIKFIDDYSIDENQASKQQYSQVIKEEPKEFKWMPPRKRLFFNVQKPITLKEQNSLCAGCARDISGLFTPHRQCQYSGKHYCTHCHNKSIYYIPGHIITTWSFKMYPISTFYLEFLKDIEKDPLFDLSSLNAKLYKNQELLRIRNLRKQMFYIKDFLSTCSDGKSLMSLVEGNEYLCNDIEYFSLYDLVNHKQLLKNLRLLVAKWLDHVEKCPLCIAKGSYCEFCNDNTPIFPFHISRTIQCTECKSFHHKNCFIKAKCPKCLRIAKRKILSNFDQARKVEQSNTFITSKNEF